MIAIFINLSKQLFKMKPLKIFFYLLVLVTCVTAKAQANVTHIKPKLVVGIVVDQMRYDYLTRFYNKYSDAGFKRMMSSGFNCQNNYFNYVPTYTAPGHASIFTGTTPKYHGIIGNNWYDKGAKHMVYCTADASVRDVGSDADTESMSPHRMKTTTFADENRLFTQMRGKTIGISIKDRGAILPAGHTANAAYWFQGKKKGHFISSSYYMNTLPLWVQEFNTSPTVQSYIKQWNTLYNIKTYTESGPDLNDFEKGFLGKETATFPYDLNQLLNKNGGFDLLKMTPYGNSIITDFAIAAISGEQLGQDKDTDVLTISFSSTDYIGHNFGVNSKEVEDTYLRLDLDIARLLSVLDEKVGLGEYTVFLTADHGAVEVPSYLQTLKIPSGYFNQKQIKQKLEAFALSTYGVSGFIDNMSNYQIFLNHDKIKAQGLKVHEVEKTLANEIITFKNIDKVYTAETMNSTMFLSGIEVLLQNGFHQKRSGNIIIVPDPAYISYNKKGSTHGSGLNYDTHVPLLFFGKGIKHGSTLQRTEITDIAPTLSALLKISFPNSAIGQPLDLVLKN